MKTSFRNLADKLKRYGPFSWHEWRGILLVAFVFGFILSFDDWGEGAFDALIGVQNLLLAFVLALATVLIHHVAQRVIALRLDVRVKHDVSVPWLIVGAAVAVITRGAFPIIAGTSTEIEDLRLHRLGHFRYKSGTIVAMVVALAGTLANAGIGLLLWALLHPDPETVVGLFIQLNLLMALYSILPIPPLDGVQVFYVNRTFYAVVLGGLLGAIGSYLFFPAWGWLSIAFVALVALCFGLLWHHVFEKN